MTFKTATAAQRHAVAVAALKLHNATKPAYASLGDAFKGEQNLYDANAACDSAASALAAVGSSVVGGTTAVVTSGGTGPVKTSGGLITFNGTYTVADGAVTGIALPASTTMLQNNANINVINSAGTQVAGTHQIKIATGGTTQNVTLASTVAPVVSGVKINAGTVTGTGNFATITVANGVITGIVLSAS